ncbi:XRE family transcriptional regulator [Pseudomonas sp. F01002]|nr:XRE family transcriptional regulator [Pseudomonas sp. F01002]
MDIRSSLGQALKMARMSKGLIQEDFAITSSTNFISLLENGKTSPTLQKLEAICSTLDTHPLTLVALAYALESESSTEFDQLLQRVADEVRDLISFQAR